MEIKKTVTWKDAWIGLLALSSFVIVTVTIILMGGGKVELFKDKVRYKTFFPEAGGLKAGAEVWLAGVEIGQVKTVRFADIPRRDAIEVILEVDATAQRHIRTNSIASLRTIGLLGDKYVELNPGTPDASIVPSGGIVKGISLSQFDELIGVGKNTAQQFNDLMEQLQQLSAGLNQGQGSVGQMLHNPELYRNLNASIQRTTRLLDTAESGPGALGQFMSNPTLYNNLVKSSVSTQRTIASVDSLIRELRRTDGTLGKLTTDPALFNQMQITLARLDGLLSKVERGEGTLGHLTQNDTLSQEAEGLLIDLRSLVQDFRQNPRRYIRVSVF